MTSPSGLADDSWPAATLDDKYHSPKRSWCGFKNLLPRVVLDEQLAGDSAWWTLLAFEVLTPPGVAQAEIGHDEKCTEQQVDQRRRNDFWAGIV
jgi:hypothetical protein